jgi:single-strand DNA-binding protein
MMRQIRGTLNMVELIGHLGADPELRLLSTGAALCRFNLATKRYSGKDEQGQWLTETDWTTVEAWDRLAEVCNTNLQKGRRVRVVGSLRSDSWTDKETGQPRSRTYVRADEVMFLDARPGQPEAVTAETEEPMF